MPSKNNEDGSRDLYFQNESPVADKGGNWLRTERAIQLNHAHLRPEMSPVFARAGKTDPPSSSQILSEELFNSAAIPESVRMPRARMSLI
jgi:hypothetical protein